MSFGVAIFVPIKAFTPSNFLESRILETLKNDCLEDTTRKNSGLVDVRVYDKTTINKFSDYCLMSSEVNTLMNKYKLFDMGWHGAGLLGGKRHKNCAPKTTCLSLFGELVFSKISSICCCEYSYGYIGYWMYYLPGSQKGAEDLSIITMDKDHSGEIRMVHNGISFYPCRQ